MPGGDHIEAMLSGFVIGPNVCAVIVFDAEGLAMLARP